MGPNISLLISGKLGYNLLQYLSNLHKIEFVATDKESTEIISFSNNNSIPLFIGNPRQGKLFSFIRNINCDILLSINYLFLIEKEVINRFQFSINFHGSLLPKYRGRTPHVWAIINNETETGITAHFIDEGCDTGDILLQKKIFIHEKDTGFSLLEKYSQIYPTVVDEVIEIIESKKIVRIKQDNSLATVYGKRVANDGRINWDWHRERIRNWVRAQTFPYPGAFTFYENEKIIIDAVSYSDLGFNNALSNGTILQVEPELIIKTSNGALKMDIIRISHFDFVLNKTLT